MLSSLKKGSAADVTVAAGAAPACVATGQFEGLPEPEPPEEPEEPPEEAGVVGAAFEVVATFELVVDAFVDAAFVVDAAFSVDAEEPVVSSEGSPAALRGAAGVAEGAGTVLGGLQLRRLLLFNARLLVARWESSRARAPRLACCTR